MWEFPATAISKHYLRFIITSRKNIFKQLSLTPFSVTNLVIKVRQKAGVTKISSAIYKFNQLPTKCEHKNAAFFPITELQRPSNMPCLAMDRTISITLDLVIIIIIALGVLKEMCSVISLCNVFCTVWWSSVTRLYTVFGGPVIRGN